MGTLLISVTGVSKGAAFVEGDKDGGAFPEIVVDLHQVDDLLEEALEEIELGGGRMAVEASRRA